MNRFKDRLEGKDLMPSTQQKYEDIVVGAKTDQLVSWLRSQVNAATPIGTVLPLRAAVKHYLLSEKGYTEEELDALLPRAIGKASEITPPLTPTQLALYHAAVEQIDTDPAYTILTLLPLTGLRVGEITSLQPHNIQEHEGKLYLTLENRHGKRRNIPLPKGAQEALRRYLDRYKPSEWLFEGYGGGPITPHAIRKYTRKIREDYPDLGAKFSPQALRATYAALMLRQGIDLESLQKLLGLKNLDTARRYLASAIGG